MVPRPTGTTVSHPLRTDGNFGKSRAQWKQNRDFLNYLSHQFIARRVNPEPDASALFFAGNLLPDLLAVSGEGRFRTAGHHIGDVAEGVRLHLATDKHFHGATVFHLAQAIAKELLASASWETPLKRRFFLAHVITELALDAAISTRYPDLVDDLYDNLSEALNRGFIDDAATILERPVPNLRSTVERFIENRFLHDYATSAGLAKSIARVSRRAGVPNFESDSDKERLAIVFTDFAPRLAPWFNDLLSLPPVPPEPRVIQ